MYERLLEHYTIAHLSNPVYLYADYIPFFRNSGGFMNNPTPPGVPVMIKDPFCRV
jgi:hypothetical protein